MIVRTLWCKRMLPNLCLDCKPGVHTSKHEALHQNTPRKVRGMLEDGIGLKGEQTFAEKGDSNHVFHDVDARPQNFKWYTLNKSIAQSGVGLLRHRGAMISC